MGLGIGTPLRFAVADSGGLHAAAGLVDGLADVRALGIGEGAFLPNENHVGHARADLRHGCHLGISGQQQGQLVLKRHGERVNGNGRGVTAPAGNRRAEEFSSGQASAVLSGRRTGNLHRLAGGFISAGVGQLSRGREPPCAVVERADAQTDGFIRGHRLHHAVAHDDALLTVGNHAHVSVLRSALPGSIEGSCEDGVHGGRHQLKIGEVGPYLA